MIPVGDGALYLGGTMWSNPSVDVNGKRAGSYGRGHQGQRNQSDQPRGAD